MTFPLALNGIMCFFISTVFHTYCRFLFALLCKDVERSTINMSVLLCSSTSVLLVRQWNRDQTQATMCTTLCPRAIRPSRQGPLPGSVSFAFSFYSVRALNRALVQNLLYHGPDYGHGIKVNLLALYYR